MSRRARDGAELPRRRPAEPPRHLAPRQRLERLVGSAVVAGILVTGAFLPPARPLPLDLCWLHRTTGFSCLGCGLTRSIVRLLRGDLLSSLHLHPAGPLVAGLLAGLSMRQGMEAFLAREWGGPAADRFSRAAILTALGVAIVFRLGGLAG